MITGSSVHNQRIERLWRDMFRCVVQLFYRLFYYLEEQGRLNLGSDLNIYAIHYVFIPRMNHALTAFREGWNSHGIRTRDRSPNQLFVSGALRLRTSGLIALDFFESIGDHYGIEEDGLAVDESNAVSVPECGFRLMDTHYEQLHGCFKMNLLLIGYKFIL